MVRPRSASNSGQPRSWGPRPHAGHLAHGEAGVRVARHHGRRFHPELYSMELESGIAEQPQWTIRGHARHVQLLKTVSRFWFLVSGWAGVACALLRFD